MQMGRMFPCFHFSVAFFFLRAGGFASGGRRPLVGNTFEISGFVLCSTVRMHVVDHGQWSGGSEKGGVQRQGVHRVPEMAKWIGERVED